LKIISGTIQASYFALLVLQNWFWFSGIFYVFWYFFYFK